MEASSGDLGVLLETEADSEVIESTEKSAGFAAV